jgi:hypothetical protein
MANLVALGIEGLLHDERTFVRAARKARARAVSIECEIEAGAPVRRRSCAGVVRHPRQSSSAY